VAVLAREIGLGLEFLKVAVLSKTPPEHTQQLALSALKLADSSLYITAFITQYSAIKYNNN